MLFNGKLCERRSVPRQDFLSAVFKCAFEVSLSVQRAVSHAKQTTHVLSVISASRGRSHTV